MPKGNFLVWCCQCPCPCGEPLPTHASTGDPPTLSGSFGSVSCEVTAPFLWVLVWARFCLCPPRLESVVPPVLWKSYNQILLALKARLPGGSQALFKPPGWESWCGIQNFYNSGRTSFGIIVLQFVGHPPSRYGIAFYCVCTPPPISLQFLCCLWMWGILFWWFQLPPVSGGLSAGCSSGVLPGDERTPFYSAIMNQKSFRIIIIFSALSIWYIETVIKLLFFKLIFY